MKEPLYENIRSIVYKTQNIWIILTNHTLVMEMAQHHNGQVIELSFAYHGYLLLIHGTCQGTITDNLTDFSGISQNSSGENLASLNV